MVTVFDVQPDFLITEIAKDLRDNRKVEQPAFAAYAKSGAHRERAPQDAAWWHVRCASILRRVYVDGPQGTETLRTYYGGKRNRGSRPHRFCKSSGKVIRTCFQALEKQGFLTHEKNKKGRFITPAGEKYLNALTAKIHPEQGEWMAKRTARKTEKRVARQSTAKPGREDGKSKKPEKAVKKKKAKPEEEASPDGVKKRRKQ